MLRVEKVWRGALACFILAGLTGAAFRWMQMAGPMAGLIPGNVRHAHSHLMFFGWVTPLLFGFIGAQLPVWTGRTAGRTLRVLGPITFGFALLAYTFFLLYGYGPALIGERRLPLSVVSAGLNVIPWYGFAFYYVRQTRGIRRGAVLAVWDLAVTFLVISTLGAWGLALMKPLGLQDDVWMVGFIHFFLDLFSEGWFVLAVLGLVYAGRSVESDRVIWFNRLLAAGLPFFFLMGMPDVFLTKPLQWIGRAGAIAAGVGLCGHLYLLFRIRPSRLSLVWGVPLAALWFKAAAQIAAGFWPGIWLGGQPGLRILYLHVTLLGFVSAGLAATAVSRFSLSTRRSLFLYYGAIGLLLISLLPLSGHGPAAWSGIGAYRVAAWIAFLPVVAAAVLLFDRIRRPVAEIPASA